MHQHLTLLNQIYQSETQPFRKVHRMIDLFESIIKSHTVVILGEYVRHNKLSDAAKGMLAQGLRTPSLGTWQMFSRVMFEELQTDGFSWSLADFAAEFSALDKALNTDKTNVIAFRNGYAHGATPTDEQCQADIKKFDPFLNLLMQSKWLAGSVLEPRNGKVWVVGNSAVVCVHPVLLHKPDSGDASYAFFNDLKNDKVGLLNYPLSKHYREKEFYKEFHEILPLHEWKKSGNNEFYQRIEELTETFKGRTKERERLLQFVLNNHKGYMSIQGNPGIGKSALIAQFFKDLRAHKEMANVQVVEYFIRRGTQQADIDYLLNYLIKRTDEFFPQGREIRAEGKMTFDLQNQLFSKWRQWAEHSQGKKLLFLIDGLDEGVEKNVLAYMPRENFENILIIYGSRPGGHKSIDDLWATLPKEHHTKLELAGLGREDIRALIYEVANKYEVERESAWIDAVQQRSQGNPLYLRLLCNAIEYGSIAVNDVQALPDKIDVYYKAILDRYAADTVDGDALLAGLFAFAAARDYLTMAHLGLINKLGDATVQRIGSTLKEVLYENPLTEDVLDYQLFHESFREYLVKEKAMKVKDALERIIDFCATWRELEGTWEQRYVLQHYAAHAAASAREARATELLTLPGNTAYIETQKKVLKRFDATKELYRLCLLKAGELKQYDQQLSAALSLVDLKYEEANDAPQVVALVAAGDIDLALKRIESFGGTDEEGVKRRFTLYMLCLMELTLLDSKTMPHRKAAIEKLLNHLDENIPRDTSIIDWNNFFPSYLMFQMACEWLEMGLDYLVVFKRTDYWAVDWLAEKGPYSGLQFGVLLACAGGISDESDKSSALKDISSELAKQGQVEEALACAGGISDESEKSSALRDISAELAKQGQVEEALACAGGISDESEKSRALSDISAELAKQGKIEEALTCAGGISDESEKSSALRDISAELAKQGQVEEALACAGGISDESEKSRALSDISAELAKQGKIEEALTCARGISNDYGFKSRALKDISAELAQQGKLEEAASAMQEALACAGWISDESEKNSALKHISAELAKQGQVEEALACARGISYESDKSSALKAISAELAKQGKIEDAASAMQEALACAGGISSYRVKSSALKAISAELAKQGKIEEALACARGISVDWTKSSALEAISAELAKQGKIEEALACAGGISDESDKSSALKDISSELAKQGQVEEALACARGISYESDKSSALSDISAELAKQGKIEEALTCARGISNDYGFKSRALKDISAELAKQGKIEEALTCARGISNDYGFKSRALKDIIAELAKQGKLEEAASAMQDALACAGGISDESEKSCALQDISAELAKQGQVEEALACAGGISDESEKNSALKHISAELAKQGQVEEALACAGGISDDDWKSSALKAISAELAKQGKIEDAASAMQEALACAGGISSYRVKSSALEAISAELAKQGKIEEALACAGGISDESEKSRALSDISAELAKQGQVEEALACARGISYESDKRYALKDISAELAQQGKLEEAASAMQEALACAGGISDDWTKSRALKDISSELAKQGQVEEALACAGGISDESEKSRALSDISAELAKQGKLEEAASAMQDALACAGGISDESEKSRALQDISAELAKQGKIEAAASAMQQALACAGGISSDSRKSSALKEISAELAKQGHWSMAEKTGLSIPQLAERHACWKELAANFIAQNGTQKALQQVVVLLIDEARLFYLKGWAKAINLQDANAACVQEALIHLANDSESIEALMQKHALHEVFFGNASCEKINRFNHALNIQWALDIAAQFPKADGSVRLSTNLDTWLHEIEDEDDREEIELLAKKVAKGKMSEEEFADRLKGMG